MSKMPMPFGNPYSYPGHSGVDFPQPKGTPIRASASGYVLRIPYNQAGGWWTTIQYENGATIGYAHQDFKTTAVRVGQRVSEGTIIGHVGKLGLRSTGYHLHAENLNRPTEAGFWAVFDRNKVVGQGTPSGGGSTPKPKPDPIPEIMEALRMSQIRYVHRSEPGQPTEWMIVGMSVPGGYKVTTSENRAVGWGAVYGTDTGNSWKALTRAQYVELQASARELHNEWVAMQKTF